MNWANLWMKVFGTTTLCGLDMGFWVAIAAVFLIVVLMNAVFLGMKPKSRIDANQAGSTIQK